MKKPDSKAAKLLRQTCYGLWAVLSLVLVLCVWTVGETAAVKWALTGFFVVLCPAMLALLGWLGAGPQTR